MLAEPDANDRRRGATLYDPVTNLVRAGVYTNADLLPSVIWHITDQCALSCQYCFATKTPNEVTASDALTIIKKLKSLGTQKVDIAGGEPLANQALPHIMDILDNFGIFATITTSATASPRMKKWLIENCTRFTRIAISIDGGRALHNSLRGHERSFQSATELAKTVQSAGGTVRINSVVTRRLSTDTTEAANLGRAIEDLRPAEWMIIQPHPANEKTTFSDHAISEYQFNEFIQKTRNVVQRSGLKHVSLLTRNIERYSSYWLIYPDGLLAQHTEGPNDLPGIDLMSEKIGKIRNHINSSHSDKMWSEQSTEEQF